MAYEFSAQTEEKFQWLITRYPKKDAVLIPLLHKVQDEVGYLSPDAIDYVAKRMDLSPARVREVASFYTMFKLSPKGKYVIQVCHNLTCYLRGCEDVIKKAKETLGINEGDTSPDGMFTIERAECLCACDQAPVIQVNNWEYHENMSPEKTVQMIQDLKSGKGANPSFDARDAAGCAT